MSMHIPRTLCVALLCASPACEAGANFYSEASHFVWGGTFAGACTWAVDRYWPAYAEYRAWIGFGISTGVGIAAEVIQSGEFSHWDAGSNMAGAAVGAPLTDRFLLAPVIKHEADGGRYIGVVMSKSF
jgi:hypothetical protein